jgi:hypothetical protein
MPRHSIAVLFKNQAFYPKDRIGGKSEESKTPEDKTKVPHMSINADD